MNSQLINITEELENKRKELDNSKKISDENKEYYINQQNISSQKENELNNKFKKLLNDKVSFEAKYKLKINSLKDKYEQEINEYKNIINNGLCDKKILEKNSSDKIINFEKEIALVAQKCEFITNDRDN